MPPVRPEWRVRRHRGGNEVREHGGPRGHKTLVDRHWLLEGPEKRWDIFLFRFSRRINLATVLEGVEGGNRKPGRRLLQCR